MNDYSPFCIWHFRKVQDFIRISKYIKAIQSQNLIVVSLHFTEFLLGLWYPLQRTAYLMACNYLWM